MKIPEVKNMKVEIDHCVEMAEYHEISDKAPIYILRANDAIWHVIRRETVGLPKTITDKKLHTRTGKLVKRIMANLSEQLKGETYKPILKSSALEYLMQYVNASVPDKFSYVVSTDFDMNWTPGEYGDSNSCFVNVRGAHRAHMIGLQERAIERKAGAIVLRDDQDRGVGRCLMAVNDDETGIVIFNAYGVSLTVFKLVAEHIFKTPFYPVRRLDAEIYINGTHYHGSGDMSPINVFSSDPSETQSIEHVTPGYAYTCCECDEGFEYEDSVRFDDNGDCYCERCYEQHYFSCHHCGEVYPRDYSHWAFDELYCELCYDELFTHCDDCGELVKITTAANDRVDYDEDTVLCQPCAMKRFGDLESPLRSTHTACHDCHRIIRNDRIIVSPQGRKRCKRCADRVRCHVCGGDKFECECMKGIFDKAVEFVGSFSLPMITPGVVAQGSMHYRADFLICSGPSSKFMVRVSSDSASAAILEWIKERDDGVLINLYAISFRRDRIDHAYEREQITYWIARSRESNN